MFCRIRKGSALPPDLSVRDLAPPAHARDLGSTLTTDGGHGPAAATISRTTVRGTSLNELGCGPNERPVRNVRGSSRNRVPRDAGVGMTARSRSTLQIQRGLSRTGFLAELRRRRDCERAANGTRDDSIRIQLAPPPSAPRTFCALSSRPSSARSNPRNLGLLAR